MARIIAEFKGKQYRIETRIALQFQPFFFKALSNGETAIFVRNIHIIRPAVLRPN